jgi:molybdopterin synthase sulfur carrier subunit
MRIRVLFFGATADIAGEREVDVEVPDSTSPTTLTESLVKKYSPLANYKLLFAVNEAYVEPDTQLKEGDEIAVFTAVSGG